LVGIHTHRGIGEVTESHISSVAEQMHAMADALEEIGGRRLDMDELRRVVALARECSSLWGKVLNTAVTTPSPLTFFDGATLMAPAVVGRGTQWAVEFYRILLAELEQRIRDRVGAVDGERFRIYWEGMPIWGRLRDHSELFAELKACVLASTYCNSWVFSAFDVGDPFQSMARAYTELFIVRSDEVKEKYIKEKVDFFKVDGVVFHDARTCPNNSNCRYGMPRRLEMDSGVPSLIIHGDLNDLRCLSDEQTRTSIEAFVEQLEERRSMAR
jgi:benzoyl-CoA reductase/2-hydroxyglutaryl-CoA dehydratase subunit BcrC/BadD/HgdB